MSNSGFNPMLGQQKGQNKNGKPGFWASCSSLYKTNDTWRGAIDLIIIGCIVMLVAFGISDGTHFIDGVFANNSQKITEDSLTKPAVAKTADVSGTEHAANFGVMPDSPRHSQPAISSIPNPEPKNVIFYGDLVWINNPTEEDIEVLEHSINMIGFDNVIALDNLKEKAQSGDPNFQFLMGILYVNTAYQNKTNPNFNGIYKAIEWYKESSLQGHPQAQYQLGQMFRLGHKGLEKNLEKAVKWYQLAANNPNDQEGKSENELGRLYENGFYFRQDGAKAIEFYTRAAEKGDKNAQGNLGALYYNNVLVERDLDKAIYWTKLAANQNSVKAQVNLALMYFKGRVTGEPDYLEFLKWIGVAAGNGDVRAMISLGDFYRYGKPGHEINHKLAAKFYRQAALKKHPKAQFLFAEMYEHGLGVPQDNIQAYIYYNLSYENAYTPAISARENLRSKMIPAQIEHAEKMVSALVIK